MKLFERDITKQGALMLILNDQHEHLGHSIRLSAQQQRGSFLV
jgi:hypothetical protein